MNQQDDIQKRLMVFFLIVSMFMIGYYIYGSYFSEKNIPKEEARNVETKQTQNNANPQPPQKNDLSSNTVTYNSTGNFNLILDGRRLNADNLQNTVKIETKYGYIEFSKIGGRIISIFINKYNTDIISNFSKTNKIFPGEIITTNPDITMLLNFTEYSYQREGDKIIFTLNHEGISIKKQFVLNPLGDISVDIQIQGLKNLGTALINGVSLDDEGSFGHTGAIVKTEKGLIKIDNDIEAERIIRGKIYFAGEENKYFMQIFAFKNPLQIVHVVPVAENKTVTFTEIPTYTEGFFYGGAKLYSLLGELTQKYKKEWGVDLSLRDTIDFGFFGILGKPLFIVLHFIYDYIPNWGIAIIILTILLRILFFPLNHKSLKAMKKMADLAPEIEKLRKKYAKDPQKLQQEIMKLYSEAGANPMSGCLPILVQIPVFIALYNVLMVTVELKNVPFLWIPDLSDKDPYYILPILMGLSMIAQQWITPSSDKNQKMIMYIMAGVFTFLFMNFPAGLVLYWLTNNILGLLQSLIINRQLGRHKKQ
ncbi:MAG: membrane protein insertase YidC [Aquificae bacterium]|nr:membrane protein insertase YidC [Aquificota bacterium]